jgi:hypothetical protein
MIDSKYATFLIDQAHADRTGHSGRNLYAHLQGTYHLLQAWHNAEPVCLAGLFHSIYGTWHFRYTSFPIERRDVVRDLIGEHAEFLAYVFCVAERPKEFIGSIGSQDIGVTDHYRKEKIRLSNSQLADLLEIETANLIEQGGKIAGLLRSLGHGDISPGARAAIAGYLAQLRSRARSSPPNLRTGAEKATVHPRD